MTIKAFQFQLNESTPSAVGWRVCVFTSLDWGNGWSWARLCWCCCDWGSFDSTAYRAPAQAADRAPETPPDNSACPTPVPINHTHTIYITQGVILPIYNIPLLFFVNDSCKLTELERGWRLRLVCLSVFVFLCVLTSLCSCMTVEDRLSISLVTFSNWLCRT